MTVSIMLDTRKDREGRKMVMLRISHKGKYLRVYLKKKINPNLWDKRRRELKRGAEGRLKLNAFFEQVIDKTYETITDLQMEKGKVSLKEIKEAMSKYMESLEKNDSIVETKNSMEQAIESYLLFLKENKTHATLKMFRSTFKHLHNFLDNSNYPISFEVVNTQYMDRFRSFLLDEGKSNNTCNKYIKNVGTFFKWAEQREYTPPVVYHLDRLKDDEVEVITLSWEEVLQLHKLDLSANERLDRVRDIFLFECFTGQRYDDLTTLKYQDIHNNIWKNRQGKTNKPVSVPLNKYALGIIEKYRSNDKAKQDYALPILSNQKANEYLKELGEISVFNRTITKVRTYKEGRRETTYTLAEVLTTHLARKTFITTSLARNTMSVQMIMAISGHSDYKTFKRYIGFTDEQLQEAMNKTFHKD